MSKRFIIVLKFIIIIYQSSLYLTGNTLRLRYKDKPVREIIAVYCENHTEHTDTLCGHNTEC
jgi:hypothetical protein